MNRTLATFFGVGLLRPGPGTWGSAAAIPVAWLVHGLFGFPGLFVATAAVAALCFVVIPPLLTEENKDPSEIVLDEVAGQWIALWPLSAGLWHAGADPWVFPWPGWLGAFLLFRLFDIAKFGPVRWAERLPGALGVLLDDVVAGILAALCVSLAAYVAHGLMGV